MAHLLLGERFLERERETRAWHRLGTVVPTDAEMNAEEAFTLAGLTYQIVKAPLYAMVDGTMLRVDGKFANYRLEHTHNGHVAPLARISGDAMLSDGYTALDNMDIARALNPLSEVWPVETVGAIKDGAQIFATFYGGEFDIKGDQNKLYFLVTDSKDGLRAMQIHTTPVRVVCNNTLVMGIAASNFKVKIEHTKEAYNDLGFWAAVVPQIRDSAKNTQEALALLADTKATKPMVEAVINAAFPMPGRGSKAQVADLVPLSVQPVHQDMIDREISDNEYHSNRILSIRAGAWELYDVFNQQNPNTAKTLYAAAQATNEMAIWRNGHADTVDESVVFGNRSQESARAFKTAYKIAVGGLKTIGSN
jgi:hypothetical protein